MKNLSKQVGVYRRPNIKQSPLFLEINPTITIETRFGKWVVLENDWYKSSKKYTDRACLVQCECGVKRIVTYRALRRKISSSCLACRPKPKRNPETNWNFLLNLYRQRARVTKRDFHLTLPQLKVLSLSHCVYCGKEPSNLFRRKYQLDGKNSYDPEMEFRYSGIDRIDSEKGYVPGNVLSCCWECNKIKSALPIDVFLALISRIQKHNPSVEGVQKMAATLFDDPS